MKVFLCAAVLFLGAWSVSLYVEACSANATDANCNVSCSLTPPSGGTGVCEEGPCLAKCTTYTPQQQKHREIENKCNVNCPSGGGSGGNDDGSGDGGSFDCYPFSFDCYPDL